MKLNMQSVHGNLGLEGFIMDGKRLNDKFRKNLGKRAWKAICRDKEGPPCAQTTKKERVDTALIMHIAGSIPENHIPDNAVNAAKVFLAYCSGLCKMPHHWMLARG
jgi:hypothetical protein